MSMLIIIIELFHSRKTTNELQLKEKKTLTKIKYIETKIK